MGSSLMGDGIFDVSHILKKVCVRSRVSATDQIKISKSENYHSKSSSFLTSLAMPSPSEGNRRKLIIAAAYFVNVIDVVMRLYASPLYWKQAYHQ